MRVLVAGDWHGDTDHALWTLRQARAHGAQHVIVVGDFGLWTHDHDGHIFLDAINQGAVENSLSIFAVPGNHENHDHWEWYLKNSPKHKGFAYVRSRVLLSPKVNYWSWANKQFLIVGGAVSIDKENRLLGESGSAEFWGRRRPARPRSLWWPNEVLSDEELSQVVRGRVDFLFTHDCSDRTPWNGRIKPDLNSQMHRQKIDEVLSRTTPELHFHGHMHTRYDWVNMYGDQSGEVAYTQTYGLECNPRDMFSGPRFRDNYGILETDDNSFTWQSDLLLEKTS